MDLSGKVQQALEVTSDDDISDLIQKMRVLEEFYGGSEEYRGFKPFIHVYRQVTEDVNALYAQDRFNNPEKMEQLDLYFAKRYLNPMKAYLTKGVAQKPWKTYLDYCMREDRYDSLAMFLGINAHINGDLLHSVNSVGLTDEEDYNRVNGILENHLSDNLHYLLLKEHDKLAFYAELVKPITRYELHRTVIRWRSDIWKHANTTGHNVEPVFEDATEQIGQRLIQIGHTTNILTLPLECAKLRNIAVENVLDTDAKQAILEKKVVKR